MKFKQILLVFIVFSGLFTSKPTFPTEPSFASKALKVAITTSVSSLLLTSFSYMITKLYESVAHLDKKIEIKPNEELKLLTIFAKKIQNAGLNKKLFLTFAPEIITFSCISQLSSTIRFDLINPHIEKKSNKVLFIIGSGICTLIFVYKYLKFINLKLKKAVENNDLSQIKLYSNLGANINFPYHDKNLLEKALVDKQTETAKFILNHPLYVMSSKDLDLYFNLALKNYLDDIVEILIKHGFNINKIYKENKTYLEYFIYKKQLKIAKFLVKHGANKFRDGSDVIDHAHEIAQIQDFWNKSLGKYIKLVNIELIQERISVGANPYVRVNYKKQINNEEIEVDTSLYRYFIYVGGQGPLESTICKELLKANGDVKIVDANTDNHDLCPICQDVGDGELYPTKCKHYFHVTCLNNWLNGNGDGICPTCRAEQ